MKELKSFTEVSKNLKVFNKQGKLYFKYIDKAFLLKDVINKLLQYNY